MGIFKSDDDLMEKYGLSNVDSRDAESIRKIFNDMKANGLFKTSMQLGFSKTEELAKVNYLSALVEQNWIIIRQLDRLNKSIGR